MAALAEYGVRFRRTASTRRNQPGRVRAGRHRGQLAVQGEPAASRGEQFQAAGAAMPGIEPPSKGSVVGSLPVDRQLQDNPTFHVGPGGTAVAIGREFLEGTQFLGGPRQRRTDLAGQCRSRPRAPRSGHSRRSPRNAGRRGWRSIGREGRVALRHLFARVGRVRWGGDRYVRPARKVADMRSPGSRFR